MTAPAGRGSTEPKGLFFGADLRERSAKAAIHERHSESQGGLDSEARWPAHRGDYGNASHRIASDGLVDGNGDDVTAHVAPGYNQDYNVTTG